MPPDTFLCHDNQMISLPWKPKYFLKNTYQKLMGSIPFAFRTQEQLKKWSGYYDRRTPDATLIDRIKKNAIRFNENNLQPPRNVVEQGTGWSGIDLIFFYLAGADEIITYDTMPWLAEPLFKRSIDAACRNIEIVCSWRGVDSKKAIERADVIKERLLDSNLKQLLKTMNVDYRISRNFSYSEIADNHADLFYSFSVLQRVHASDLDSLFTNSYRVLRTGGSICHRVHMRDFHAITDKRIPGLYYLSLNSMLWSLMTSKYVNHQNRLRFSDFERLINKYQFQNIRFSEIEVLESDIEYATNNFQDRIADDAKAFATYQADVYATKSG